jgi:MFS transporter, ACS family, D-galactonate transporter
MHVREIAATPLGTTFPGRPRSLWLALALLVVSVFINYVDRGNLSIAAPLLKGELGLSITQLGILFSAFFWTYTVMLFVCGWFMDRFDASRVLALGFLCWSLATAATGMAHGFAMLLIMRLLLGMGESVAFPCCSNILARHFGEEHRGFANGIITAGMKLGPVGGTLGAGALIASYGWRPVFVGIGLASLLWLPAWKTWMPRVDDSSRHGGIRPQVIDILRKRVFWATAAGGFCVAYPLYFVVTWLPFYLIHEQGLSMYDMVNTAALYYAVDAAAALATGGLTDFCIRHGMAVGLVRKSAMCLGWSAAAIGFMGCAWADAHAYLPWLMLAGVGLGTGNAGLFAITQTLAGPRASGRWCALQNGFANLAGVICPALTGLIVDWTGHFRVALGITAGVCLLGTTVWAVGIGEVRQVAWTNHGASAP